MNTSKTASTPSERTSDANSRNPYPELARHDLRPIGHIGKPHGVRGEVMFYFDDDRFDRDDADHLFLLVDGLPVPFAIEEYRFRSDETCLLKLQDVDSEHEARQLTGCQVLYPRSQDEDGALTWGELLGYTLINSVTRHTVGRIAEVNQQTINTLFVLEDGRLVPAADEWVTAIDRQARTLSMTLPEGLMEL